MKALCACELLLAFLIALFFPTAAVSQDATTGPSPAVTGERIPDPLRQFNSSLQVLASRVSPAVVQITASGFGAPDEKNKEGVALVVRQQAFGSGIILDSEGYIMTNAHVVEGAQHIRVVLPAPAANSPLDIAPVGKRQILDAKLIGEDKEIDLALLKVEGHNLPALTLDAHRSARPGEFVMAIGSPEGLQNSVTVGVVSSVWRQPNPDQPMVYIQTDAPINSGNSGGPLVDLDGDVIGLNTFIITQGGGSEGLGFAIPAEAVRFVYEDLRKRGFVRRTEIEADAQEVTPTLASGLGLAQDWGVVISDVRPEGAADKAGLKAQDVIVAVDSRPILALPGLTAALYLHPPDQDLPIVVLRGGQRVLLKISPVQHHDQMDELVELNNRIGILGVFAANFQSKLRSDIPDVRIASGVVVVGLSPGPDSEIRDFRYGDIIHSLNHTPIESVDQLRSGLHQLKARDPVVLQVERQGKLHYFAFDME